MSTSAGKASPMPEGETIPRRKLRKGTSSCRECKRRKIRCLFVATDDVTCIGCQRRGMTCLSQEFGDDHVTQDEDLSMRGRLIRVERLLAAMMGNQQAVGSNSGSSARSSQSDHEEIRASSEVRTNNRNHPNSVPLAARITPSKPPEADLNISSKLGNHEQICRALHAALPSQQIANQLIDGQFSIFLQILCNSYNILQQGNLVEPLTLAALPKPLSHPVLAARKLLQLAVCFQQMPPGFDINTLQLPESPLNLMTKYVNLASDLVTSNDTLLDSLEGMECLIIEGLYLINSGNLRRAWFCFRRATTMGQFLGFHRGTPKSLKVLDPSTRASCSIIWTRIIYAERYLSLLLGLPSSINHSITLPDENAKNATPTEKLDSIHAIIFGLIIERNQSNSYDDYASTQKIDNDLQMVAKSVLPEWWSAPDLSTVTEATQVMADIIRSQTQIIHFNVVTLVHLPYMLSHSAGRRYDYSKIMCIYASREVLSRFITFRGFVKVAFCCRWVDFCAFTAALSLLLGHLEGRKIGLGDVLTQQRTSDRALIEKAMDTMDELNLGNNDLLSKETASVVRKLLAFEAAALNHAHSYSTRVEVDNTDAEHEAQQAFRLTIPYFDIVSIGRDHPPQPQRYHSAAIPNTHPNFGGPGADLYSHPVSDPLVMETLNSDLFGSLQATGDLQLHVPYFMDEMEQTHDSFVSFVECSPNQTIPMGNMIADANDWAFQGVDTTFFNAVLQGDLVNRNGWDTQTM